MLAKKTSKNQLTLPKAIVSRFPAVEYFEVSTDGASISLKPVAPNRAAAVRQRLEQLGLTERDVQDAVEWSRNSR